MIKQIGTRRYNTEAARFIAIGSEYNETVCLYMKKTGEFFTVKGEQVNDLTTKAAADFAIKFHQLDNFEKATAYFFAEKKQINPQITVDAYKRLQQLQIRYKLPLSEMIERIIMDASDLYDRQETERLKAIEHLMSRYQAEEKATENPST